MITQDDLDLISNPKAFNPDPVREEAGWLERACWIALVLIVAVFTYFRWSL